MTRMPFADHAFLAGYCSGGYWRFSDARSVQSATSDRASMGGQRLSRCPHARL